MWEAAASVVGSILGANSAKKANKANLQIARENRAWQERMSNTAYQRSADDLEKAGLNRIIALGNSASTPSGNTATMTPTVDPSSGEKAVASALAGRRLKEDIKNLESTRQVLNAERAKKVQETDESETREHSIALQNRLNTQKINVYEKHPWLMEAETLMSPVGLGGTAVGTGVAAAKMFNLMRKQLPVVKNFNNTTKVFKSGPRISQRQRSRP